MRWFKLFSSEEEAQTKLQQGKVLRVRAGDKLICIVRNQEGFFAIQDRCPHMDVSLSKGKVTPFGEITCPWHAYQYDLKTGRECKNRSASAEVYPIEAREDGMYLGLS